MPGASEGGVRIVLRLEGLCVLLASAAAYSKVGLGWDSFALFFFTPDLSLLGYLAGHRIGAATYNLAHSYIGAIGCAAIGVLLPSPTALAAALIWCAHIGFDRVLGYGLKYSAGFGFTHLGRIGPARLAEPVAKSQAR